MPVQILSRRWGWVVIVSVVGCAIGTVWWMFHRSAPVSAPVAPVTFDGRSEELKRTAIVPTLDSPIPAGKSAIWCASFQLAWNRLKNDVSGGPIQLADAQSVADRLNQAEHSEADLEPAALYAAAGWAKDGIVERIQREMANRFPDAPTPELGGSSGGVVAYAYLSASAKYEYPYFENDEPFVFKDSAGTETDVGSFGVRIEDEYAYNRLRGQVGVLYYNGDAHPHGESHEFVVDLCKSSQPYQVVLAKVARKTTLAETLADVERKIAQQDRTGSLGVRDTLLVPNMAWRIAHHFSELEGKKFTNPALEGLPLDTAGQTIQFRLDRNGAELASESKILVKPEATYFHVNRPFLIYMKQRSGKNPFFVMWVDNAELLQPR